MKLPGFGVIFGLCFLALPVWAEPLIGVWKTNPGADGRYAHVKVERCGTALCGVLIKGFDAQGRSGPFPLQGRKIFWDMTHEGSGVYSGGKVYDPTRDRAFNGRFTLTGNALDISGCVMVVCRSGGVWTRAK